MTEIKIIAICGLCQAKILKFNGGSYLKCPYCGSRFIKVRGFDLK